MNNEKESKRKNQEDQMKKSEIKKKIEENIRLLAGQYSAKEWLEEYIRNQIRLASKKN
jgi:hypothetical protein